MSARSDVQTIMEKAAEVNADEVVFGDPATDIVSLEAELKATFPDEFKDIYRQFDGVRLSSFTWWLVPVSKIHELTSDVDDWLVSRQPDLVGKCVFFGDWGNSDAFGYLKSEMEDEPTIIQFNHETGDVFNTNRTLSEYLESLAETARRSGD